MTANHVPQPPEPTWSPEARTWVSLLLFAHLFALFVAVTTYTRPSLLQDRLHNLFEPYLRNLHLTAFPVSYPFARFHLTHGGPADVDFSIEVDVERPGAAAETVTIPAAGLQPLVRFRRYQALANATGTLAADEFGDEAISSILPKAIAASVLRRHDAAGGAVRIRAHGLTEPDALANLEALVRASKNVSTVFDAQAIVSPAGVELLRKATTLEVAPVERAPRRRGQSPRQAAPQKPPASQE